MKYAMSSFLRFTAVCAILTAMTTFLLWLLPKYYPVVNSELDKAMLYQDPFYMGRLWVNFVHILLAFMAYLGTAFIIWQRSRGLALAGFLWFVLWGFTELLGISVLIFAVNYTWRKAYPNADEAVQALLQQNIDLFMQWWDALFFVLLVFFFLGTLFYGLGTWQGKGLEKVISVLFLFGVPLTIFITISGYTSIAWPGIVAGVVYPVLQPVSRALLGVWLWSRSRDVIWNRASPVRK